MAKQSSREISLERRKALSTSGKKSSSLSSSSPNRVRSSADVGVTRTDESFVKSSETPSLSAPSKLHSSTNVAASTSLNNFKSPNIKRSKNSSRELVIARREALSLRGKSADKTKDRTRVDVAKTAQEPIQLKTAETSTTACCEPCAEKAREDERKSSKNLSLASNSAPRRKTTPKRRAIENSSRALVLARREALSKHGKSASKHPTTPGAVARQGNPDLSSREVSQRIREFA